MSKNKADNSNITLNARNTLVGSTNRRGEFIKALDENDRPVYSSNLGLTFRHIDSKFEPPVVLSAERVRKISESFPKIKNLTLDVDYVIIENSIQHFKATGAKPEALGATYKPLQADMQLQDLLA